MRVRAQSATGDYTFGQGQQNFLINTPACVAQVVATSLLLHMGEWYLDTTQGMPWESQVLGKGTESLYDSAIKSSVLGTQGVSEINNYVSSLNASTRALTVDMLITTIYSTQLIPVSVVIPLGGYGVYPYGTEGYGE